LIWSNLYKVAPVKKGNPSTRLIRAQRDLCIRLLKEEVTTYAPRRILFLTGYSWAKPFLSIIDKSSAITHELAAPLELSAKVRLGRGSRVCMTIVAPHPQGKKEKLLARSVVDVLRNV
jgi:hypothetical protein